MDTAPTVRRATTTDVPALTRMLARAFHDDPVAVWACRSDPLRTAMLEGLYRARLQQVLLNCEIWTTAELSSAAVWMPPGGLRTTPTQAFARVRCVLHPRLIARLPLLASASMMVQRRHPRTPPHWYLSLLGTDPGTRGKGLGSAVLKPVLDRCDAEGIGVHLESAKERNIDFYARCGFRLTGSLRLPRGPRMWLMWREPAGQL